MNALGHFPDHDPRTGACRACGGALMVYGKAWRHARPRCDAPMRFGERCARAAGHAPSLRGAHRTRYAMDCQAASRRTGMAA